ncbi:hypothetical protein ACNJNY_09140 [Citrobacter freundii]
MIRMHWFSQCGYTRMINARYRALQIRMRWLAAQNLTHSSQQALGLAKGKEAIALMALCLSGR